MHPRSPHSPARLKARRTFGATDPLSALETEVSSKVADGPAFAHAHAAADELMPRRPRRPSYGRAAFRTPPTVR